jgi:ADP-heptose:LPS heptosyltransferase
VKILAIKCRRLGDTVLWTAALEALLQLFPTSEIDLALPAEYDALFQAHPSFKTRFAIRSDKPSRAALIQTWRARHYDLALVFHASPSTRALARGARAKKTLVHHHDRRGKNFGSDLRITNLGKPMPATERDLNVVRTLGFNGESPATKIYCAPEWKERAAEYWKMTTGAHPSNLVVLSPGASRLSKRWPLENYAWLVDMLPDDVQIAVVAPDDSDWRGQDRFRNQIEKRARFVWTPKLEDAMGLLSWAQVYVGADSGLKHVAAALDVPTVTLFGPESVGEWHPYKTDRHRALRKPVLCRTNDAADPLYAWCGVEICPLASHACLSLTTPQEVAHAIERYL